MLVDSPGEELFERLMEAVGESDWQLDLAFVGVDGRVGPGGGRRFLRLPPSTPLAFELRSERPGYLQMFYITEEGGVLRLYPGPGRETVSVEPGETVPLARELGVALGEEPGLHRVVALVTEELAALPPRLPGEIVYERALVGYPHDPAGGPAAAYLDWLTEWLAGSSGERASAFLRLESLPTLL